MLACSERRENRDGEQELQARREWTGAVPTVVVEDLLATRAQEGKDVFEVRRGARCSAKGRRVKQAASRSQEEDAPEATADLEPTRVKVPVRDAVAGDVEKRTQNDRCEP